MFPKSGHTGKINSCKGSADSPLCTRRNKISIHTCCKAENVSIFARLFRGIKYKAVIIMEIIAINGQPRTDLGKKGTKAVRNGELIPCVLYGAGVSEHFSTEVSSVRHLIYTPDFKVAEITVGGKKHRCIVKAVQYHPVSEKIMHIDFLSLVPGHPVKVEVPLRFTGSSIGVKGGGKLLQNMRRVKIKTMPEDLISELNLDITNLDMGQSVRVRDIKAPQNVEILTSPSTPVATIEIPRALRSAAAAADKPGKK